MKRREFIGTAAGAAAWSALAASPEKNPKPSLTEAAEAHREKPVRLRFEGDLAGLRQGIDLLARELNFEVSPKGAPVRIERRMRNTLVVEKKGKQATIRCSEKIHFFRGLGLLLQEMKERKSFSIREEPQFQTNGVMFDVTQGNAVINVQNVKNLLNVMAVMGLNMIMLYSEDSYKVEAEPYLGYMRGKYTQEELREIDHYADIFGIEAIPCMQTLAHLEDVLKWDVYEDIREDEATLLVGSEKTYQFIERTVRNAAAPFKTKRIHIGMDEAWKLGQGNYLKQHGLRRKIDIMTEHLDRVLEITARNGLQPMIWSDMYFRAASATGDYYDRAVTFSPQDLARIPRGVQFVYWDYYNEDPDFIDGMLRRHKQFGSDPIFAGGIWGWQGFGVQYGKTFLTTNLALEACKKNGIREVFATIWGDCTTECTIYEHLLGMQLFAEHGYQRNLDEEKLKKRFLFCTGCRHEDFWEINGMNAIPGLRKTTESNPSRYLMWQDVMMGLLDKNVEGIPLNQHYAGLAEKFAVASRRNGKYNSVFSFLERVSSVLAIKGEIGPSIHKAYAAGDLAALKRIKTTELPELTRRVSNLREYHRALWFSINQPFGWEVLDIRYGGLLMRINTAIDRLDDYLGGSVKRLDELEEKQLLFQRQTGGRRHDLSFLQPDGLGQPHLLESRLGGETGHHSPNCDRSAQSPRPGFEMEYTTSPSFMVL
jgi:hexosaminidase